MKKAAKRLYFLKVLKRSGLTSDHLGQLHFYVAVIRPILEYCSPVLNHNLPQYLSDKIESIRKRAIRIICSVTRGISYIFALFTLNYLHYNSADKHWLKNCSQKFVNRRHASIIFSHAS